MARASPAVVYTCLVCRATGYNWHDLCFARRPPRFPRSLWPLRFDVYFTCLSRGSFRGTRTHFFILCSFTAHSYDRFGRSEYVAVGIYAFATWSAVQHLGSTSRTTSTAAHLHTGTSRTTSPSSATFGCYHTSRVVRTLANASSRSAARV